MRSSKIFVGQLILIYLILNIDHFTMAEQGIMQDRTPHPVIPLESYKKVDLSSLFLHPRDYAWTQIHLKVYYDGIEKGIGYEVMRCVGENGKNTDKVMFIITNTTQMKGNILENVKLGDLMDLYCMVESTLSSGVTVVMIEKVFLCTQKNILRSKCQ